jgi:chromosome partitioning protein
VPVITFSSPKGGCGKTTAATLLATTLAAKGADVTVIDADPNRNVVDWFSLPGAPQRVMVVGDVSEETIVDHIEAASEESAFVLVDLEGAASLMVSYAISMSDFVVVPMQGSQLDAKQAARQMRLIKSQERMVGRPIPFAVLLTRTNPAIQPKTQRFIQERFSEINAPVFRTKLFDREAFRAIFSYGGDLPSLKDKGVSNLQMAIDNAAAFAAEVVERLREKAKEDAA